MVGDFLPKQEHSKKWAWMCHYEQLSVIASYDNILGRRYTDVF